MFLIFFRRKVLIIRRGVEYSEIHKNNASLGKTLIRIIDELHMGLVGEHMRPTFEKQMLTELGYCEKAI